MFIILWPIANQWINSLVVCLIFIILHEFSKRRKIKRYIEIKVINNLKTIIMNSGKVL